MAKDLRCSPDFLKGIEKTNECYKFACFVRGMKLMHPFIVEEKFMWLESWPQLSSANYVLLRRNNKAALTYSPPTQTLPEAGKSVPTGASTPSEKPLKKLSLMTLKEVTNAREHPDPSAPSKWKPKNPSSPSKRKR